MVINSRFAFQYFQRRTAMTIIDLNQVRFKYRASYHIRLSPSFKFVKFQQTNSYISLIQFSKIMISIIHDRKCYEFQTIISMFISTIYKIYQQVLKSPEIPQISINSLENSPFPIGLEILRFPKMGKNSPGWQRWSVR